ncbi:MAG: hypothetical protein EA339_03575 [Rhodobacteraceae bacterium]|nr:MAG: hypothetical protein EA339_03575 [Paracoccaceae bacterium]
MNFKRSDGQVCSDSIDSINDENLVQFSVVYSRILNEVNLLAESAGVLDVAFGEINGRVDVLDQEVVQSIDLLRQSLVGLELFLRELEKTFDAKFYCDPVFASSVLGLKAQVSRLGFGAGTISASDDSVDIWR